MEIVNVVASVALGVDFDLEDIRVALGDVEYEPKQFPGLVHKQEKPKTAALIFGSGKIICTGATSIEEASEAINKIVDKIRTIDPRIPKKLDIEVQNIVATTNLDAFLNLDAIAIGLEETEYEPEQFPGLVYRMKDPKVVLLLFGSGKIVCTGARNPEEAELAVKRMEERLKELNLL